MADKKINVGGRLHSIATGNILAGADEILDDSKGKKQSEINVDIDNALADRYTKDETYNKNELNSLITTPDVQYVTVSTYSQLPATGSADTIYKVSSYDGTAVDATKYAEYAWDGSSYVLLSVKSAVDEIFDISVFNAESGIAKKYESLTAALAGIPSNRQKGGMSVKFIQSSDNKYVQYRLTANEWSIDTNDWVVDAEVYVENSEFVRIVTDNEGKILYGVKSNGDFVFGVGVPQSIKDYVLSQKADVDADVLAEKTRAMAAEQALSTNKVDKEEGKGLIPTQYIEETENPEFIKVVTDNEDKILYGVKANGSFYFGLGVPQQVIDYVTEHQNATREELLALIDTKVDKVEGKSLIDTEYASSQSATDNPDFLQVSTDLENKVLEGIKSDGTKVIGGDLHVNGSTDIDKDIKILGDMEVSGVLYKAIENPEYLVAWIDQNDKIVFGLRADGKTYIGDADFFNDIKNNQEAISEIKSYLNNIPSNIDWDALSSITTVENQIYIDAKTDSEGKLLAGRTIDGAAFEKVGFSTPKASIDGATVENIEDPEGRTEIKTDAKSKILSYRDADGVLHENVGIKTSQLKLVDNGITELEKDLKEHGFTDGFGDWSDKKELHIAEPYCAVVNITGVSDMPQQKYSDDDRPHAYMQFWDMNGNYFKKEVLINAQGRSTMAHPKKNIAIDICNNNGWDDGDTFSLQIGDWVPQDSFHLKAFYNDPFRCLSAVAYKLYDEVLKSRGEFDDYVWKRALLDFSNVTPTSTGCADAEEAIEGWNTNARCFPMGFPCIVYLNGDFYGIYSWQLKKHRDNYMMSKKKTKHIHLDGLVNPSTILNADGDSSKIIWTTDTPEGIEIRNPKPKKKKDGWEMTMMDGTKYDADANGGELIDSTSANWDATNESHVKSAEVKQYILNLSKVIPALTVAYSTYQASSKTDEDKAAFKEVFETYFDVNNQIDYLIFSDVLANYDGFNQNVQWITYNGKKWYLCAYDLDGVMGNWWRLEDTIVSPVNTHYSFAQFQYIPIFYNTELETRYKELRDMGIISVSNIINLVEDWLKRIGGKETFEKEWKKWPSFIKNDNIHRLYKWLQVSMSNMDVLYHYN